MPGVFRLLMIGGKSVGLANCISFLFSRFYPQEVSANIRTLCVDQVCSVAQQAVRHSPVPILVLNEHGLVSPASDAVPLRVLVPVDGSLLSESAIEPAVQLLLAWTISQVQGELHLLHVVDLPPAYGKMKSQAHITDSIQEQTKQEAETYVKALVDHLVVGPLAGTKLGWGAYVERNGGIGATSGGSHHICDNQHGCSRQHY